MKDVCVCVRVPTYSSGFLRCPPYLAESRTLYHLEVFFATKRQWIGESSCLGVSCFCSTGLVVMLKRKKWDGAFWAHPCLSVGGQSGVTLLLGTVGGSLLSTSCAQTLKEPKGERVGQYCVPLFHFVGSVPQIQTWLKHFF